MSQEIEVRRLHGPSAPWKSTPPSPEPKQSECFLLAVADVSEASGPVEYEIGRRLFGVWRVRRSEVCACGGELREEWEELRVPKHVIGWLEIPAA